MKELHWADQLMEFIDMVETAENVWSDSCVATIVDKETPAMEP